MKSKCCNAPIKVVGLPDFGVGNRDDIHTIHWECEKCGLPCDPQPTINVPFYSPSGKALRIQAVGTGELPDQTPKPTQDSTLKEKYIRLKYYSRRGYFNFANPSEESISCNMAVFDEAGNRVKNTNFRPEYEVDGDSVENAIYLLEEADRKVLFSSSQKEWREMIAFLKEKKEEIEEGNKKFRVKTIMEKIGKLQDELKKLTP